MSSPVVILEKEVHIKHQKPISVNRITTVEFISSLALIRKIKQAEKNHSNTQNDLKQIFSLLQCHSKEISNLQLECTSNSNQIQLLKGLNEAMKGKIDFLLDKLSQLEKEHSFEMFKNKQLLQKHESLLIGIHNSKSRYRLILDVLIILMAFKITLKGKGIYESVRLKSGSFYQKQTIGKFAEVVAMFFILKTVTNNININSTISM